MKAAGADALLRYRVLRPLGPTRFGHAQLALLEGEGKSRGFFALELLREDWAKDEELRASFLDEAAHTLSFEHPNVVRTQEVLAAEGVCGRVTRWFAGQSLAVVLERVGRAQLPLQLHVRVLCEVLAAVQYLHEREQAARGRLVYRDTAPAHVLVTYTGQIKIVGAGFERTIDEIERRSGAFFSDIDYASPELCLGYPAAPSADVYSVGVMLWEALARARRVFADTPEAKVRMRINGEEPDVDQFRHGVPDRLAQICRRALAVSPRDRYASAQELQIDLESFLADTETDAQQNAGLGALAELMGQHFAAERAEMLSYIEQQLAEPELPPPSSLPASRRSSTAATTAPAAASVAPLPAAVPLAAVPLAAVPPAAVPSSDSAAVERAVARASAPPVALRLEVLPPELQQEDLEDEGDAEAPTELLPTLEPARWDDHTHTITSFEELGPIEPGVEAQPSGVSRRTAPGIGGSELEDALARVAAGAREGEAGERVSRPVLADEEVLPRELLPDEAALQHAVSLGDVAASVAEEVGSTQSNAAPEHGSSPRFLHLPEREPDTSGHRAYSSTLRPPPPPARSWLRTAAPVGLAAAVVLLVGYGVRVVRSSPEQGVVAATPAAAEQAGAQAAAPAVSSAGLPLQAAPAAAEVAEIVHPSALAEVAIPTSEAAAPEGAPGGQLGGDIVEQIGDAVEAAPGSVADPAAGEAIVADAPAEVVQEPGVEAEGAGAAEAAAPEAPPEEVLPEPPALIVEELLSGEERRPPPRARRSRAKVAEGRAARSSLPQPRTIDETDPYLD